MSEGNGAAPNAVSRESFKTNFASLEAAILAEWPSVDRASLAATGGELDQVVELVAEKTEHTRTLVRKQLGELEKLNGEKPGEPQKNKTEALLEAWEKKTALLAKELREKVLVDAEKRVRENVLVSLLVALGLGLLVGIFIGGGRRGGRS